jgi:hypothetical protein
MVRNVQESEQLRCSPARSWNGGAQRGAEGHRVPGGNEQERFEL